MTRTRWILVGVIATELVVGALLAARRLGDPVPPAPGFSAFDDITAADLRAADTPDGWARLGELYLAHGYFPEAEATLREEARRTDDAEAVFRHGFALERLGRVADANGRYREALASGHPRAADLWHYVALNHLRAEDEASAADALAKAGDLPAARYALGRLHLRGGRLDDAEREGRWLVGRHPTALQPVSLL